jgi:hypothetical protein
MGASRFEQLLEDIWTMINENSNYSTGYSNFLLYPLPREQLRGILLGGASNAERGYWETLLRALKLPRRTAVISLIRRLLAEAPPAHAPPAHVEEAAPTEAAGSPPCWANIEDRQQGLKRSSDAAGLNRSPGANSQGYLAPVDPSSACRSQHLASPSSSSSSSSSSSLGPSTGAAASALRAAPPVSGPLAVAGVDSGPATGAAASALRAAPPVSGPLAVAGVDSGPATGAAASALRAAPPVSGPLAVAGVPALASNVVDAASPAQIRPMAPFSPAQLGPGPNSSTFAAQPAAAGSQTTPDASQEPAELPEQVIKHRLCAVCCML